MPTFAQFDASEEVHRGATATVWRAAGRRGGADNAFAVKVCRPAEFLDEGAEPDPYLAALEEVVADLRALSEKNAQNWIEVTAKGGDEQHVFWVAKLFPRSLHTVMERAAQHPPEDFHWLASAIAFMRSTVISGLAPISSRLRLHAVPPGSGGYCSAAYLALHALRC